MLKNYLKITLRSLWRNKVLAGINIFGLSVGIAACLLILVYVWDELSYDAFQEKSERIARVTMEYGGNGEVTKVAVTGTKVAPAFSRDFPEIESAVRLYNAPKVVEYQDKLFEEEKFLYADSTFFRIFTFPLIQGNAAMALTGPDKIVLSAQAARKYFGTENPVGKILKVNNSKNYTVTGVAANVPVNSQIKFDMVASFASLAAAKDEQWFSANYYTYFLLRNAPAIPALQNKIPGYMRAQAAETGMTGTDYLTYKLEPLGRVHLHSELSGLEPNGDLKYIYIFGSIAGLILLIACINYINLTTAYSAGRAKEVGIRKVIGAHRSQLIRQFIGESFLLTFISLLIGLLLVRFFLPALNSLTGRELTDGILQSPFMLGALILIAFSISVLAGSFPAFALANFKPVTVLKGSFKNSDTGVWLRQGLIVFQFVISTFLIVSALVVHRQLNYIQNKKIGYNNQQVLVLPTDEHILKKYQLFKSQFKQNPHVSQVTLAYETPTHIAGGYSYKKPTDAKSNSVTAIPVEKDFLATLGIPLAAGRDFNQTDEKLLQTETDEKEHSFILNESAAKQLGYTAAEAVGKHLEMGSQTGIIRGIVKDFHFAPLHETISPLVIFLDQITWGKMLVKIEGNNVAGTLANLKNNWTQLAPHRPFSYRFLDQEYAQLYRSEQRTEKTFTAFAFLAIMLACLGLFGLAAFTMAQRTKEIGIRKVLGASLLNIFMLLSKSFLLMVLLANLLAWPLIWWAMNRWLQDFAYRISISYWLFAGAGLAVILVALLTISFQAMRVAGANPVKALRSE